MTNPITPYLRVQTITRNYQNERNANEITDEEQLDYKFDDSNQDIFSYGQSNGLLASKTDEMVISSNVFSPHLNFKVELDNQDLVSG